MSSTVTVTEYSPYSMVVRGDTKQLKDQLKGAGAKWNPNLKGGAGWICSKKIKDKIEAVVGTSTTSTPDNNLTEIEALKAEVAKERNQVISLKESLEQSEKDIDCLNSMYRKLEDICGNSRRV
jgi:hypothetical protein